MQTPRQTGPGPKLRQRRRALGMLAAGTVAVVALAAPAADSPNEGPFRTSRDAHAERLMLEGHDPVAYFRQGAAVPGDPAIQWDFRGVTWRFASTAHRDAFQQSPERYMPQFGGYCSNGINYSVPWGGGGGPNTWRIYRGKLYVFGGQGPRDQFEMDTELNLARAHRYWNEEIAGGNAVLHRWWRLTFRVPHYRSDASLKAEWEARRDAGTLPVMPGQAQVVPAEAGS